MSLDRCGKCGHIVDTDKDVRFCDYDYKIAGGLCTSCRDDVESSMTNAEIDEHERRTYG